MLYLGVLYMLYMFGSGTSGIGMTMTMRRECMQDQSEKTSIILLMEVILHHLGCINPYEYWDIYYINWCKISSINSMMDLPAPLPGCNRGK